MRLESDPTASPEHGFVRTRWWWVRHAPVRTDGGRFYGQADIACDCGDERVFSSLARVLPPDAVWVASHLGRTHQTARALWDAGYGLEGGPEPRLRIETDLAEQNLGEWQGLDRARFHASRPSVAGSYWFAEAEERPRGGESFADVCARVRRVVERLTREYRGRDIIAVAHGGSIRAALAVALGVEPQTVLAFAVENCSLTRLDHLEDSTGAGWRVGVVNERAWLAAPLLPAAGREAVAADGPQA